MLTIEQMKSLKKVNVSKDAEKTKARIKEDFKSSSNKTKAAIVELSGLSRHSFYNAFDSGSATPKVILSLAQILDVSPYYYSGAEDEKGACSNDVMIRFLEEHEYYSLAKEIQSPGEVRQKRKYTRRPKPEEMAVTEAPQEDDIEEDSDESNTIPFPVAEAMEDTTPIADESVDVDESETDTEVDDDAKDTEVLEIALKTSQRMKDTAANLDEESAVMLLKALYKRAEAGGDAEMICDIVKQCLLA